MVSKKRKKEDNENSMEDEGCPVVYEVKENKKKRSKKKKDGRK